MIKEIPGELYKQIVGSMPVPCVDMVVHKNGKVLLVYRKNEPEKGKWWVIGGRIFKGERLIDAVKRKVKGEVGLEVKNVKCLGIEEYFSDKAFFDDVKTGTHSIVGIYLVEVEDGSVGVDETSSDYKWVSGIEEDLEDYVKKVLKMSGVFE